MSQYNKTVLTRAGLELAKRANSGQAKFGITRAVTSADDWSHKTVQDLEEVTTIPNIMQQGTIMDTDEVESNNSVIGVSLCFTNKNLSAGYQIRVIGLYVKEEGQENDFLYAVTTAITPEYMPSFADKVLYKFNMQMYLVIGKAQAVNVVINEGTAVTRTQFDKYKVEVTENLKELENTHKEDMSHVAKSASVNGGAEILPDSTGKLNLVVPDPDLSKYVSLEQLGELLKAKADTSTVNAQIADAKNTIKSNVDNLQSAVNTKASQADFDSLKTLVNNVKGFNVDSFKGGIPTTDINKITDSGLYGFANQTLTNSPFSGSRWGLLFVLREYDDDANNIDQFITSNGSLFWRNISLTNNVYPNWKRFADDGDVDGLKDQINAVNNKVNVGGSLFRMLSAGNTWNDILGFDNGASALVAFRGNSGGPMNNLLGNYSAGVAFGGGDTKGFLEVSYADHNARIGGGNGNAPAWHEDIAWKSDVNDLRNQVQQLKDNQFEVQTFTDATAAANWEAQRPGKRMAIVNQ